MTRSRAHETPARPGGRTTDGWRTLAWAAVVVGVLVVGFAGVIFVSASRDFVEESGGDDSLAPLGLIIAGFVGAPAVIALVLVGLSFARPLTSTARKTLVFIGAATLAVEVPAIIILFALPG